MNIRARPSSALGIKHIGASMKRTLVVGFLTVLGLLSVGCNGTAYGVLQPNPEDLFANARPIEPDILDFRHLAKHVPIPGIAAQEIGVDTILSWTQDVIVAPGCVANGAGASFSWRDFGQEPPPHSASRSAFRPSPMKKWREPSL